MLNQIIRRFAVKCHKASLAGSFINAAAYRRFRLELGDLQERLRTYTKMLADMAGIDGLTNLEQP